MELKWLLISSEGNLDRKGFWITILTLNFFSLILDEIGNSIFLDIGQDKISFFMFFLVKMIPRLLGILILVFSFFIAKKRINDNQKLFPKTTELTKNLINTGNQSSQASQSY